MRLPKKERRRKALQKVEQSLGGDDDFWSMMPASERAVFASSTFPDRQKSFSSQISLFFILLWQKKLF